MISTTLGEKPLQIADEAYFQSLMNSTLLRDGLLIRIPDDSRVYIMENGNKLYLHTDQADDMQMQEVEGVVVKKGKADVEVGDTVIFHYLSLNNGRDGTGHNLFTFVHNKQLYLLMPYSQIFFSIKDGKYISHNDNFLVEGIEVEAKVELDGKVYSGTMSTSGIVLIDVKKQPYEKTKCRIISAPSDSEFKEGDIAITNGVWDVPIKSETMRKKEKKYYRCSRFNVVCHENFLQPCGI